MKIATILYLATFAYQVSQIAADSSVCSSGLYAALAPLDNYPPAVTYCQGQAGKVTVTVTVTLSAAAKVKRVPATTATTTTTLKTSTTTTSKDAKASSWSSLVQQAQSIIATFCSCAGYPATQTITVTSTPPASSDPLQEMIRNNMTDCSAQAPTCSYGASSGKVCRATTVIMTSQAVGACDGFCSHYNNYGQGCTRDVVVSSTCTAYFSCCI